jgi:hypothetical protein
MAITKLIAVLGATGNQGGSVVDTFLEESGWRVRGITRNATSSKAQSLVSRGVEVVEADMDVLSTLESAFQGVHAIFVVSDYWGLYQAPTNQNRSAPGQSLNAWAADHEELQLRNVISAAAKISTLERFVFSSLSDAIKWSKGKYTHVYHFQGKANAEAWGKKTYPDLWENTSILQAGYFLSNFLTNPIMIPKKVRMPVSL